MSDAISVTPPPDMLNEVGVLKRREIEARILGPVIEALANEFERERVIAVVRETIVGIARQQGAERAAQSGDTSLTAFASTAGNWRKGNAMDFEVLEQNDERYSYDVTRCGYADMYRSLGMAELGAVLSCNRDASLIEGFNPDIELVREQTIMQGASSCTFRYAKRSLRE